MIKHTIFFLLVTATSLMQAQTFSVAPNPILVAVDLGNAAFPYEIVGESMITNNTSDTLNLKWQRIVNNIPECWETSVFGVWVQALPFVDSLTFDLHPNAEEHLNVSAFLDVAGGGPYSGEGEVVLKITNRNDSTDTLLVTFDFLVTGDDNCITSVSTIGHDQAQVYPNPVIDFFKLKEIDNVRYIIMYDNAGNQIYRYEASPDQNYFIGDIHPGAYWIKSFDQNNRVLTIGKLVKI